MLIYSFPFRPLLPHLVPLQPLARPNNLLISLVILNRLQSPYLDPLHHNPLQLTFSATPPLPLKLVPFLAVVPQLLNRPAPFLVTRPSPLKRLFLVINRLQALEAPFLVIQHNNNQLEVQSLAIHKHNSLLQRPYLVMQLNQMLLVVVRMLLGLSQVPLECSDKLSQHNKLLEDFNLAEARYLTFFFGIIENFQSYS